MSVLVRVIVSGRVQGVWFRAWTEKQARALGFDIGFEVPDEGAQPP